MHFIKEIFTKKISENTHNKFIKYSKGNFVGPLMKITYKKNVVRLTTSIHYLEELIEFIFENFVENEIKVKGKVINNASLRTFLEENDIHILKESRAKGIFKYEIETNLTYDKYKILNKYKNYLNMKTDFFSFNCKNAIPKPNKEVVKDFCKFLFPKEYLEKILIYFVYDSEKAFKKKLEISHQIEITDVLIPKKITDFQIARKEAKRVGTLERVVSVDEEKIESKTKFKI